MTEETLDLGLGGGGETPKTEEVKNQITPAPGEEKEDINGGEPEHDTTDKKPEENKEENKEENANDDNSSTGELEVGTQIEFDGVTYTVDENHNLVDDKGNIFKKAEEVEDWLKENEVEDDDDSKELTIDNVKASVGVEVTDENGNPVDFTNDAEGIASYVKSVMDLKSNEIQEATINKFLSDNPLVKNFIDYVTVTGTYEGFGDIKDRSLIVLDKEDANQHEAIIRMAAKEFGNASLSDSYIKYLRDNGGLYDEAATQLNALIQHDKQVQAEIRERAIAAREQEERELTAYWRKVDEVVKSRKIGGFQIPESFTKEVDGKKLVYNINDFYNYLSRASYTDENNNRITAYQRDLNAMSDDEVLNVELLDAYLHFTGGSYKDLMKMAINEAEVRKLKIKSKEHRATKPIKITKPDTNKTNSYTDIALA